MQIVVIDTEGRVIMRFDMKSVEMSGDDQICYTARRYEIGQPCPCVPGGLGRGTF